MLRGKTIYYVEKKRWRDSCLLISLACIGYWPNAVAVKACIVNNFILPRWTFPPNSSQTPPTLTPPPPPLPQQVPYTFESWTYIWKVAAILGIGIRSRLENTQGCPAEVTGGFLSPFLPRGLAESSQLLPTGCAAAAGTSGSLPRKHMGTLLCSFSPLGAL